MPKKPPADPAEPPDQHPDDYSDVLEQTPDIHPDLRTHVERLASEAGEMALTDDVATTGGQLPIIDDSQSEEEAPDPADVPREDVKSEIGETALESSQDSVPRPDKLPTDKELTKKEREEMAEKWLSEHLVTEKISDEDFLFDEETKTSLKLIDKETVPPEIGSEVVANILAREDYDLTRQLLANLMRFSSLDGETADVLLESHPSEVLDHIGSFSGLAFDKQLADRLLQSRNGGLVVGRIKDFKDIRLDTDFANKLVDTGNAYAVIEAVDSFDGVKLDSTFVDRALRVPGNGYNIAVSIDKFSDVDADDELAQKILAVDDPIAVELSIENFHDLSNATAAHLLGVSEPWGRTKVYKHIEVFPDMTPEVLLQIIDNLSSERKTYGLDELPTEMQSGICALMIDREDYGLKVLQYFTSLDGHIAQKLIDQGHVADVLESMDKFPDFDFDLEFAKRFMACAEGYPQSLISNIEKFPKDLHSSIAQLIIDRGYADQLVLLIENGKIDVDQVLAEKIALVSEVMRSNPPDDGISAYLDAFPGMDHHMLAERLIRIANRKENETFSKYDLKRIAEGLSSLKGLGNSIAEKLIANGGLEVLASHLDSFSHLDSSVAQRLLADRYISRVLLNQDVFDDFVLTAGQGRKLMQEDKGWSHFGYDLKLALEYMDPDKPPVFDNELAHRMIDGSDIYAISELFDLFDTMDENVAKNLIEFGYAAKVFDNLHRFENVDQLDLAKIAISNHGYLQVFKRLDQFEGLENLEAGEDESVGKFIELIKDKELLKLLGEDGPLHILSEQFLILYMRSDHPEAIRNQLKSLANGNTALWRINQEYAKLLIGEVGDVGYLHNYKVSAVPLALPRRDIGTKDTEIPEPIPFAELDEDTRRMVLSQQYLDQHPDFMTESEFSFTDLSSDSQDTLLAYRLYEAIARSRDVEEQTEASERNKIFAESGNYWNLGDLVHATGSVGSLRNILLNGVLCGETIGASTAQDSYPFNVDTVVVSEEVLAGDSHQARLEKLNNRSFGGIVLLFHRTPESTDYGRETQGGMNDDHRLVFGAMPSTDISAILLRSNDPIERDLVVDTVVESGIYIPIVDEEGSLLLGYEDYQARRADGNYVSVQPRIIDSSFQREGTQLGSNEGAMFVIPEVSGPYRYYVKFGDVSQEKRDHLWTEILADRIYRAVTPHLVPETDAVIVEGRLAKTSKIVEADESLQVTSEARNAGFVMDAFLGNWDAVFNSDNLIMTGDGRAMRIDTGNSLDFRARGGRKEEGSFGEIVQEIETGTDNSSLGDGMRQMYPGLTDDDIKSQVRELRDRLPDEMIDALVESIRRPKAEREKLARILKARKQYLIDMYL